MHRGDSGAYSPLYHRKPRLTAFNTFSANVWHNHQHYDKRCILKCTTKFSVIYISIFSGFGGLVVSMLVPEFAGSNTTEAVGFFLV
jgi:hypothetical protein